MLGNIELAWAPVDRLDARTLPKTWRRRTPEIAQKPTNLGDILCAMPPHGPDQKTPHRADTELRLKARPHASRQPFRSG
jgi:hypothetical protein